ncbi:MAG: hypothetical protein WCW66_04630 [Patescibacteria group bacterium]|jgi:hypothetical protein
MDKSKFDSEKSTIISELRIGLTAGFIVLLGDVIGDFLHDVFSFRYYLSFKLFIPIFIAYILIYRIEKYKSTRKH